MKVVDLKLVVLSLIVLCFACDVTAGFMRGRHTSFRRGKFPHDIKTKSGLQKLLKSKVVKTKYVHRPLIGGKLGKFLARHTIIRHAGVVVTTKNGKKYLIHKGKGYGKPSNTVVVNAKHMSSKWKGTRPKKVGGVRISKFVKAGGKKYNLIGNNCQHAAHRMFRLG